MARMDEETTKAVQQASFIGLTHGDRGLTTLISEDDEIWVRVPDISGTTAYLCAMFDGQRMLRFNGLVWLPFDYVKSVDGNPNHESWEKAREKILGAVRKLREGEVEDGVPVERRNLCECSSQLGPDHCPIHAA